jgi:hypothetical protein
MSWHDSSLRFPEPMRSRIQYAIMAVILFVCYFAWWIKFDVLRDPAWWVASFLAVFVVARQLWLLVARRPPTLSSPDPSPTRSVPGGSFDDGRWFALLAAVIGVWWIVSTYSGGTASASFALVWEDRTLRAQGFFVAAAIIWLAPRGDFVSIAGEKRMRWIASYALLGCGMLVMVADTDYQLLHKGITWEQWIRWRCLNYGLVLPYLVAGLGVINGWRVRRLCITGIIAVVVLAVLLWLTGIQM